MALTTSLTSGDLPSVLIVIPGADIPASDEWTLTGSGAGLSWTVRGGSGTGAGAQVVLVDALAPVNVTITYTLTVDGTVSDTDTITRTYAGTGGDGLGRDVVADLVASTFAGVRRLPGDQRSGGRRFHASLVAGARFPALRVDPTAGAGGGSMQVASVGAHTSALRGLLDGNAVLAYYHDTSRCDLPGCPVPAVDLIFVTSESSDVGARRDVGELEWSLSYLLVADPDPNTATPYQTWDDYDAAALTGSAFDLLALTVEEFALTDWATV